MENDTIKDLKLLSIIYKVLAFIIPVLIVFTGIYYSQGYNSIFNKSFSANEMPINQFFFIVVIAIVVAISFYAKGLSYSYKACLLQDVYMIKDSLKKEDK